MARQIRTRSELGAKLFELTFFSSALLFVVALFLMFSIVFFPSGIVALAMAVAVFLLGLAASVLIPYVPVYRRVRCPACQRTTHVFPSVSEFDCAGCGTSLRVPAGAPGVYPFAGSGWPLDATKPGEVRTVQLRRKAL